LPSIRHSPAPETADKLSAGLAVTAGLSLGLTPTRPAARLPLVAFDFPDSRPDPALGPTPCSG